MRTISIQEAKIEISVYHSYGHKINTSSPGWQEIKVKGRRNRKKEIVVKIKTSSATKGKTCSYDGVQYVSINECIRCTGVSYEKLLKSPLFSKGPLISSDSYGSG